MFRAAASAAARGLAASNSLTALPSSAVLIKSMSSAATARQQPWQSAATIMLNRSLRPHRPSTSSSPSSSFASSTAAAAAATATRRAPSFFAATAPAAAPSASSFASVGAAAAATVAARRATSSSSSSFSFSSFHRRSHLDFPRRESVLQRLFGRGGSSGGLDGDAVLYSLIGLNVGVYALWQLAPDPNFARRHFVVSAAALADGRLHTLFTSAFSHRDGATHLLVNMVSLFFFGRAVGRALGGRALLSLYLAAGAGGSLAHCAAAAWPCLSLYPPGSPGRRACVQRSPGALGASAAVNGVVAYSCLAWPSSTVLLWGILPVPAALLGAAFVFQDVLGAWRDMDNGGGGRYGRGTGGGVAHAGHLGGAAVGALAWAALRRRGRRW